jgi:hypothetical protein
MRANCEVVRDLVAENEVGDRVAVDLVVKR